MAKKKTVEPVEEEATLGIYVMSYKRADCIKTANLLEHCTYVVREEEADEYRAAGITDILEIPEGAVENGQDTYWWIVDNAPEDIIFVADDDIPDVGYRTDKNVHMNGDKELIMSEIERIAQLLLDLNLGYAFTTSTATPYNYTGEFAFKGCSGSMKWVNKAAFKAKKDPDIVYNYDIDIVFQELLGNRICLIPNYLITFDAGDVNKGGETAGKMRQDQIDCIHTLKNKWGKYYNYDFKKNRPRINVPR